MPPCRHDRRWVPGRRGLATATTSRIPASPVTAAVHAMCRGSDPVAGSCAPVSGPTTTAADEPSGVPSLLAATTQEYVAPSSTPVSVSGDAAPWTLLGTPAMRVHVAV